MERRKPRLGGMRSWRERPERGRQFPVRIRGRLRGRIRGRIKRPKRPPPILKMISPADIITLMNFLCGIFAVMKSVDGGDGIRIAMVLIMAGIIFDGLDGPVARRFGSSHRFGVWLDSIADAATFCIAPAILVYNMFKDPSASLFGSVQGMLAIAASVTIALLGILRLARFSFYAHKWKDFIGLPTPAMGLFVVSICSFFYWGVELGIEVRFVTTGPLVVIPILLLVTSLAMVADIRYRKFKGRMLVLSGLMVLFLMAGLTIGIHYNTFGLTASLVLSLLLFVYLLSPISDGPSKIWGASKWADLVEDDDDDFFEDEEIIEDDEDLEERVLK